jgi:hypothetical protein
MAENKGVDGWTGCAPAYENDVMPGNSKECRKHALRCAELAMKARTEQLKALLLELSKNWEHLALSLEHGLGQLDGVEIARSDLHQSLAD